MQNTVLVVEGDAGLRAEMACALVALPGVAVVAAGAADEAWRVLAAMSPRVLFLDLVTSADHGLEVISALHRGGSFAHLVLAAPRSVDVALPRRPWVTFLASPVTPARLREVVAARLGLEARDDPFSLVDYIQLGAMGRRSVRLTVSREGRELGHVVLWEGAPWHAEDAQGIGPAALSRLLDAGGLAAAHAVSEAGPRSLHGSCEGLLLEHFRRADEAGLAELDARDLVELEDVVDAR
jgi:CheY-like chemotaxis protein